MTERSYNFVRDMPKIDTVSPQKYREAMSHFAAAVHIVTTDGVAGKRGVTISACCSVSDNPPTVLVCLMRHVENNHLFIDNGKFCINTLSGHHQELSNLFAGRGHLSQEERFAAAKWKKLKTGAPILKDALASLDCQLVSWYEHATHYILIGEVVAMQCQNAKDALVYLDRAYHKLELK